MDARDVGFIEATKIAFAQYFNFQDRSQRAEYWWFFLFTVLGTVVFSALDGMSFGLVSGEVGLLSSLFFIATLIPSLSMGWRRMHDIGKSGWWIFLPYATLIWAIVGAVTVGIEGGGGAAAVVAGVGGIAFLGSIVYVLVLLVTDSDPNPNRFGPSPKYGAQTDHYQGF